MALKDDGTVWTWDDVQPGVPSDGTTVTGSSTPVQVAGLSGISAVACGSYINLAIRASDGSVWVWGLNQDGELGDGLTTNSQTPVQVMVSVGSPLLGVTSVSSGGYFSMALKSDGTVWTWGRNESGQLGIGSSSDTVSGLYATQVLTGVSAISAGATSAMALKTDGTLYSWGGNYFGVLSNGTAPEAICSTPAQVTGLTGTVTAIATGYYHSLVLNSDGTVWAWGLNADGELGNGTTTDSASPVPVSGLTGITAIQSGEVSFHSLALKSDGTLWAWGDNDNSQLGTGAPGPLGTTTATTTGTSVPVQVIGLSGTTVTGLACGKYSSVALTSANTVLQWGDLSYQPYGFSTPLLVANLSTSSAPVITPAGGSYASSQSVAISTTLTTGSIYYTLDGTEPDLDSPAYSGAFTLGASALVSAVVLDTSGLPLTPVARSPIYIADTSHTGLPTLPTGVTTSVISSGEIDLSWTLSGTANYSRVNIYRSTDGGAYVLIATLDPGALASYQDTNVQSGHNYQYEVGTANSSGINSTSPTSAVSPSVVTLSVLSSPLPPLPRSFHDLQTFRPFIGRHARQPRPSGYLLCFPARPHGARRRCHPHLRQRLEWFLALRFCLTLVSPGTRRSGRDPDQPMHGCRRSFDQRAKYRFRLFYWRILFHSWHRRQDHLSFRCRRPDHHDQLRPLPRRHRTGLLPEGRRRLSLRRQ